MSAGSSPSAGRRLAAGVGAFLRRTPEERRAVLRALPVLLRIESGLRREPLPRLAARLGVHVATGPGRAPALGGLDLSPREALDVDAARRLVRWWPAPARCLRRSLLVGHALRARRPELRIGVARHDGRVHAHAWIEVGGVALQATEGGVDFRPLRRASDS